MTQIERAQIEEIKKRYPEGTRVRLISMDDEQAPPSGTEGTVERVDDMGTVFVRWDTGSGLGLIIGEDRFSVIG